MREPPHYPEAKQGSPGYTSSFACANRKSGITVELLKRVPNKSLINMADDRVLGYIILLGSLGGVVIYYWLLFMSPWMWLTIQVSAFLAVGMVLLIMAWIGYTLATTPPPMPLEDFDFETETGVSEPETETEEEASE